MNYQIADAKTRYFNDKQHYLNFLQAWKKAAQRSASKGEDWGCLTGAHMVMYALLRGKDIRSAFTPTMKESKLRNGAYINHGMYWAYESLSGLARAWNQEERVTKFLAPFKEVIDKEVLFKLIDEMPQVSALYSNYGKGITIAEKIINWKELPASEKAAAHLKAMEAGYRSVFWALIDMVEESK
ncbi:hypothetical protein LCGC14_2019510 [marine sediment metagenome]|uniref:Uncharacterized protein n=1 Tax=marine sediment metagenome TaxID=412755 RepID=A0A0F9EXZ7_9ZZZZ